MKVQKLELISKRIEQYYILNGEKEMLHEQIDLLLKSENYILEIPMQISFNTKQERDILRNLYVMKINTISKEMEIIEKSIEIINDFE